MDSNTIAEVKDGQLTRGMEAEAAYLLFTAMQAVQDGLYIVQFSGLDLTTQLLKLNADTCLLYTSQRRLPGADGTSYILSWESIPAIADCRLQGTAGSPTGAALQRAAGVFYYKNLF